MMKRFVEHVKDNHINAGALDMNEQSIFFSNPKSYFGSMKRYNK
jgi:hypothetical protein